jgi:N-acyl-D-amino-acid deacylase
MHKLASRLILVAIFLSPTVARSQGDATAIAVSGKRVGELAALDDIMRSLLADHEVPGAALAVSKDGRTVYSRGFGWADADHEQPVQPDSLFRIASISKPITAAAILQLAEQGRLRLDDRVLDLLKLKPAETGDSRLTSVTIRHCLQHTGGWDREKSFDPMFRSVLIARTLKCEPPAQAQHVIQYMLGIPLDFAPGERYAYSNFGYCILGRIIETVTGKPYEEHVRTALLAPLGIQRMQIGHTLSAGRAAGEVMYHDQARGTAVLGDKLGQEVPSAYGAWYLEAMDSHGGWIASAPDLVRFAAALNSSLKADSITSLLARPDGPAGYDERQQPKSVYYACGWNVRVVGENQHNTWHTGSLPGTSTILVRRHDGIDWCVLFNRRDGRDSKRMSAHADERINEALSQIRQWPAAAAGAEGPRTSRPAR